MAAGGLSAPRVRCAVLPPVPVPYREPLFEGLASGHAVDLRVIYQAARAPGWDAPPAWFPAEHAYDAVKLPAWQRARADGRTPVIWPRGLEGALHDFQPDCVVAWEYGPAALRAFRWCRARRRPLVIFTECTPAIDRVLPRTQLRLHRWLASRAAGFIAASTAARERLLAMGVPPAEIEVSLQAAETERLRAVARERGTAGDERAPLTVLTVGRLVADKNIGRLLEAFARARIRPAEAVLEVCGTGPLEAELRDTASRLGVEARFRGYVSPEQLPGTYEGADAFALVSTLEPFGVVVREAVAAGLPLICTRDAGAAGDLAIEGRNALLVDPRSTDDIAAALRRLIDDTALRARLARESRAVDAEASTERSVAAFERAVLRAARS
jgi:glycosyltransferase involved in cell wall biosynthesis